MSDESTFVLATGKQLSCAQLSSLLGAKVRSFHIYNGTERIWPQSSSAILCITGAGTPTRVFAKASAPAANKSEASRRKELASNRVEARFYRDFVPVLRERGVPFFAALAIEESSPATGGMLLLLEAADEGSYFQASPLTSEQIHHALGYLAAFHAAAWEHTSLLTRASTELHIHGGGWWSLHQREEAELARMLECWPRVLSAFEAVDPELVRQPSVVRLAIRLRAIAPAVSALLDVEPMARFCTLMHGDFKAANIFLPCRGGLITADPGTANLGTANLGAADLGAANLGDADLGAADLGAAGPCAAELPGAPLAVGVDFQWVGHGLGMRDVAYHLTHAASHEALSPAGAEQGFLDSYCAQLRARLPASAAAAFTDEVARRHYELGLVDYARLLFSRFVTDASEANFAATNAAPRAANIGVLFRDVRAAPRFIRRIDRLVTQLEAEFHADGEAEGCSLGVQLAH